VDSWCNRHGELGPSYKNKQTIVVMSKGTHMAGTPFKPSTLAVLGKKDDRSKLKDRLNNE